MSGDKGPRKRRKAERPHEILQAARETFSERGFAATRLDDVAARAGITKGTIYVYFANKEELFIATVRDKTQPVFDHLTDLASDPKGPALDLLRAHFSFVAEHAIADPGGRDVMHILLAEAHRFPDLVDGWYVDLLQPALAAITQIIRYGVERGEFRATAITDFPQLLMAPIIVCNNWQSLFGDRRPLDLRRFFDVAFDLITGGLVAPREPNLRHKGSAT